LVIAMTQVDLLLLGLLAGPEQAGPYAVAVRGATLIIFGLLAVNIPLAPAMSQLWATGHHRELQALVTRAARLALVIALPVAVAFILLAEPFLSFFGPEFVRAAPALAILSVGQLAHAAAGPVGVLLLMTGHQRPAALAAGCGLVANAGLCLVLIPRFGAEGAALSSAAGYTTWVFLLALYAPWRMNVHTTALGVIRLHQRSSDRANPSR
jgi:O-antigen/teichoic acid export membrane protein